MNIDSDIRPTLLSQEHIDPLLVGRVNSPIKLKVPSHGGVYALLIGSNVVYVGMSENLLMRIGTHLGIKNISFTNVLFWTVRDATDIELRQIEKALILKHRPKYNMQLRLHVRKKKPKPELTFYI